MPIKYDIETDYLYQKGFEKGYKIGYKIKIVCNARREGASIEFIARIVELTPQQVREILDKANIE